MSKSNRIKNKFTNTLNEMMTLFHADQNTLDMIAALKKKVSDADIIDEVQVGERSDGSELPLPKEIKAENDFALFSDGACRGNPGPGAWGSIGQNAEGELIFESSGVEVSTTNNRMELIGAIDALESLKNHLNEELCGGAAKANVFLYSDSKYVVDGMKSWVAGWKKRGWKKADKKVPENVELWQQLDAIKGDFWQVNWHWVKGHAGHPQNERCDQIANNALDDSGF